jgi:hypothetical protein
MISMRSSARSALKLRDNRVKREQNPRHGHYNGLSSSARLSMPSEKIFISPRSKYTCARACPVPAVDWAVAGIDPSASITTAATTRIASKRHNVFMTRSTLSGPSPHTVNVMAGLC